MNIRVDLATPITDGTEVVFRSPVDCSQITGLILYYPENGVTTSKEFAFADAHGNNVGDIDHLFAENVVVKVILDLSTNMAFVQNADTNAYLEGRIDGVDLKLPQNLTKEQKEQARENIGATNKAYVDSRAEVIQFSSELVDGERVYRCDYTYDEIYERIMNGAVLFAYAGGELGAFGMSSGAVYTSIGLDHYSSDGLWRFGLTQIDDLYNRVEAAEDSIGAIETALDSILAIQNALIGGAAE